MSTTESPRSRSSARKRRSTRSEPFTVDHFEWWARRLVLDTGKSWRLEAWQASFVDDVFRAKPMAECWEIVPEGNAKTTKVGGLALYGLRFANDASIPVAASSRDQARILYRQAKGFIKRSQLDYPDDDDFWMEAFDGYKRIDLRTYGDTKRGEVMGSIEIHAADAGTGDGVIPYPFAVLDELHRHRTLELYETWRGKLDKRGAKLIAISTGGEFGGEFELAREKIRQETRVVHSEPGFVLCRSETFVFHEYALEEGAQIDDFEAVKRANPLKAISVGSLRKKFERPTTTVPHWQRMVCNLPSRATTAAIQEKEWHDAATAQPIPERVEVWLGLDVGWRLDTTAFVPLWWKSDDHRQLGPAVIIEPPGDGSSTHPDSLKFAFNELAKTYAVTTVVMDTNRAEDIAAWLSDEGVLVVDRAQTNEPQSEDYERFMSALRQGHLLHSGDVGLRRHALNAVARTIPSGKQRFARPSDSRTSRDKQAVRVIDALVAAAMVHSVRCDPPVTKKYRAGGIT